ncbi:hypothetical protein PMAYCL1PPCAC_17945, partial [Pristionchus mayeri]
KVSERCFNSCDNEDCKQEHGKKRKEFFTCNQAVIGPLTLRTFNPNPSGVSFTVNKTHYFTSLENVTRGGRLTTLCLDGMKFKVVITSEVNEEMHRTTMEHPLFSASHFHHTHPASTTHSFFAAEHTTSRTVEPMVTRPMEMREKAREEPILVPMLTDKSGFSIEEVERLDRLTSYPPTPYTLRGVRHDSNKLRNHKFDRIGNTVMYTENGEMDEFYEVALPLGIDGQFSSKRSRRFSGSFYTISRSISEYADFHNLAARSDDYLCNSPDLKRILHNHMNNSTHSISSSLSSITSALEASGERFVVLCSPSGQSLAYSLPHEAEFCSSSSSDHSCHIFTDPRHVSSY